MIERAVAVLSGSISHPKALLPIVAAVQLDLGADPPLHEPRRHRPLWALPRGNGFLSPGCPRTLPPRVFNRGSAAIRTPNGDKSNED